MSSKTIGIILIILSFIFLYSAVRSQIYLNEDLQLCNKLNDFASSMPKNVTYTYPNQTKITYDTELKQYDCSIYERTSSNFLTAGLFMLIGIILLFIKKNKKSKFSR